MNKTVPAYHSMLPRLTSKENKRINKEKVFFISEFLFNSRFYSYKLFFAATPKGEVAKVSTIPVNIT